MKKIIQLEKLNEIWHVLEKWKHTALVYSVMILPIYLLTSSTQSVKVITETTTICIVDTVFIETIKEIKKKPVRSMYALGMFFLKSTESIRLTPYKCAADYTTIGWGHVLKSGEWSKYKDGITYKKADELLKNDFDKRWNDVNKYFPKLENHQKWALALVGYNIKGGVKRLKNAKVGKLVDKGEFAKAGKELRKWVYADDPSTCKTDKNGKIIRSTCKKKKLRGLVKRREFEARLLEGDLDYVFSQEDYYRNLVLTKIEKENKRNAGITN